MMPVADPANLRISGAEPMEQMALPALDAAHALDPPAIPALVRLATVHDVMGVVANFLDLREVQSLSEVNHDFYDGLSDLRPFAVEVVKRSDRLAERYDAVAESLLGKEMVSDGVTAWFIDAFLALPAEHRTPERYDFLAQITARMGDTDSAQIAVPRLCAAFVALLAEHRTQERYAQLVGVAKRLPPVPRLVVMQSSLALARDALSSARRTSHAHHDAIIEDGQGYDDLAERVRQFRAEIARCAALEGLAAAFCRLPPGERILERYAGFIDAVQSTNDEQSRAAAVVALGKAFAELPVELRTQERYSVIIGAVRTINDDYALCALDTAFVALPDHLRTGQHYDELAELCQGLPHWAQAQALSVQAKAFAALRPEDRTLTRYNAIAEAALMPTSRPSSLMPLAGAFTALCPKERTLERYNVIVDAVTMYRGDLLYQSALCARAVAFAALSWADLTVEGYDAIVHESELAVDEVGCLQGLVARGIALGGLRSLHPPHLVES